MFTWCKTKYATMFLTVKIKAFTKDKYKKMNNICFGGGVIMGNCHFL